MTIINEVSITFLSYSANEWFARTAAACFAVQLGFTMDEVDAIKTAVKEAVTNCIVHAYPDSLGKVTLRLRFFVDDTLEILVEDRGVGIEDVKKARTPSYITGDTSSSGMGFAIMESLVDYLWVSSAPGKGTVVTMKKAHFQDN